MANYLFPATFNCHSFAEGEVVVEADSLEEALRKLDADEVEGYAIRWDTEAIDYNEVVKGSVKRDAVEMED